VGLRNCGIAFSFSLKWALTPLMVTRLPSSNNIYFVWDKSNLLTGSEEIRLIWPQSNINTVNQSRRINSGPSFPGKTLPLDHDTQLEPWLLRWLKLRALNNYVTSHLHVLRASRQNISPDTLGNNSYRSSSVKFHVHSFPVNCDWHDKLFTFPTGILDSKHRSITFSSWLLVHQVLFN